MADPIMMPDDAYGNSVSFTTDGVHDYYLVSSPLSATTYTFSAGTAELVVYLSLAIQENIALFQLAAQSWVTARYTLDTRFNFIALYTNAQQHLYLNRMAYISQLFTWADSVIAYSAAYITNVKAQTDPVVVSSIVPDFTQAAVPDPMVSPLVAIGINS